jgi:carbonic anhydrase
MSDLPNLLEGNRRFAETFTDGDLAIRPRLSTVVLTCLDARVDPAYLFDLQLGDALVIRNGGGRMNSGVLADLAVLGLLAAALPGEKGTGPELVILHHTDCGMSRFADPAAERALAGKLGIEPGEVAATMAITDPAQSVRDDIARLSMAPGPPDNLIVSGLVYDVADGTIDEIVAPGPLRVGPS